MRERTVLIRGIEIRSGFIQDEQRSIFEKSSCQADALCLSSTQARSAFTNHRLILLWQRTDKFMRVCELCCLYYRFQACLLASQANILRHCSMKQIGMLGDPG